MARKGMAVRSVNVMGKFKTRSRAASQLKLMVKTTQSVRGTGTYKLTKTGPSSTPYVITRTSYMQRRKS
jgi:hypothetical protein